MIEKQFKIYIEEDVLSDIYQLAENNSLEEILSDSLFSYHELVNDRYPKGIAACE